MNTQSLAYLLALLSLAASGAAQRILPLGAAPDTAFTRSTEAGPLRYTNASGIRAPFLYYFPAPGGEGGAFAKPAVLLCPGGGYHVLAYEKEGLEVARRLAANGVATAVLMSRLPATEPAAAYPKLVALEDGRAAMALLRAKADSLGIDASRLAVMGFSAGGHLAMLLSTLEDAGERPAASALIYPVVTMAGDWTHDGSTAALLGPDAAPELRRVYSGEHRVDARTPPTFLVHAADDTVVPVRNVLEYASALDAHDVPFELHVLPEGGHGFGMYAPGASVDWVAALVRWLGE